MKPSLSLILLLLCMACNTPKNAIETTNSQSTNPKTDVSTKKSDSKRGVTYTYSSRGQYKYISLINTKLYYTEDSSLNTVKAYHCPKADVKAVFGLLKQIDESSIHKLQAPSNAHTYDGAPAATLNIVVDDMVFSSPTFDHGNPPKQLQAIITKIETIAQNVVTQ